MFVPLVIAAVGASWLLRGFLSRELMLTPQLGLIVLNYVLPQDIHSPALITSSSSGLLCFELETSSFCVLRAKERSVFWGH